MISPEELKNLAALSRLEVADDEISKLHHDIGSILGYVDQIQQASLVSAGQKKTDTSHINIMRPDQNPHQSGIYTDDLISLAPKSETKTVTISSTESKEGKYVKVKKIL